MSNLIIDSHSHIGIGFNHSVATLEEYKKIQDLLNIDLSLLMPQPILYEKTKNQELLDKINSSLYQEISLSSINEKVFFIPMVSPIYTPSYVLEKYIEHYQPIAFKIHLKNDSSHPDIIPESFTKTIKRKGIPLIVHTDYSKTTDSEKDRLKNLNSALSWFNYFKKNEIKGYLTHGARLSPYVLEQVNFEEGIGIGIGPDILLSQFPSSLEQSSDFLTTLYNYVNPERLFFDIDYNWNLDQSNNLEINSITRIKSLWNVQEQNMILGENSNEFFGIAKRLQKK